MSYVRPRSAAMTPRGELCPVDRIRPTLRDPEYRTTEMLYIDPQTCIDWGACKDTCPVALTAWSRARCSTSCRRPGVVLRCKESMAVLDAPQDSGR